MTGIVDAHVHLWDVSRISIPWFSAGLRLPGRVAASDFREVAARHGIDGFVAVQAADTRAEVDWLVDELAGMPQPRGAVVVQYEPDPSAWAGATGPLRAVNGVRIAGVRVAAPTVRPDLSDVPGLDALAAGLAEKRLVMELLIRPEQLPGASALADRHPDLDIVLCHLGLGARDVTESWSAALRDFARRPRTAAKFSGVLGRSDESDRAPALFAEAMHAFGGERLMFGSDWPMSTATISYADRMDATVRAADGLAGDDTERFWGATARRIYRL